jgi:hypothetical protein
MITEPIGLAIGNYPQTGFAEVSSKVRERDFWPE